MGHRHHFPIHSHVHSRRSPQLLRAIALVLGVLGLLASLWSAAFAAAPPPKNTPTTQPLAATSSLSERQKALHVLNRLAFGPRPGDLERVQKLGLKQWIDLQLSPTKIDDTAVDAQLKSLHTVNFTVPQLQLAYAADQLLTRMRNEERRQRQATEKGEEFEPRLQSLNPRQQEVLDAGRDAGFAAGISMQVVGEMEAAKLVRAIHSERQLQEVLTDFWTNHFNLDIQKGAVRTLRLADERDAIRPHVLGRFRDLLGASAHSPAMMLYLDNAKSSVEIPVRQPGRRNPNRNQNKKRLLKPNAPVSAAPTAMSIPSMMDGPAMETPAMEAPDSMPLPAPKTRGGINENYARELMELHTMGVDGGYTQKDVQEVARCFTGWGVNNQTGEWEFNARRHDTGEKTVLGQTIPAGGGEEDGEKVLDILASHPSTARYLARKLAMRFVSDNPPPALVERAAKVFLQSKGDLRAVTRSIVTAPEFFAASNYRSKIKSPFEYVVSAVRALGGEFELPSVERSRDRLALVNSGRSLARMNANPKGVANKMLGRQIAQMGQPLYAFQAPTGYTENSSLWVSSGALVARLNFALDLTNGRINNVFIPRDDVFKNVSIDDSEAMLQRLVDVTLHGEVSPSTRKTLELQMTADAPFDASRMGALLLGSPEFQRR